jgi:hypothetical protein
MMTATEYEELFIEIYNSGEDILNYTTKEIFAAEDGEEFRQCWADTPTRRDFPKYWFVSRKGNLLSVKTDKIQWLHKNKREKSNKISYKFMVQTEDGTKIKNIEAHNLVGLVWESESFGVATKQLKEKGLDAIGINNPEEPVVQGHHLNSDDTDNRPENIKFITDRVHVLLGKAPKRDAAAAKHFEYMDELAAVMKQENPDGITVVLDGGVYDKRTGVWSDTGDKDIFSVKNLQLSPEAAAQLWMLGVALN